MYVFFSQQSQILVRPPVLFLTGPYGSKWVVNSTVGVVNATLLLETEQPSVLEINIPMNITTPPELKQLCKVIQQKFTGRLILKLWHSFLQYDDCSAIIRTLARSR